MKAGESGGKEFKDWHMYNIRLFLSDHILVFKEIHISVVSNYSLSFWLSHKQHLKAAAHETYHLGWAWKSNYKFVKDRQMFKLCEFLNTDAVTKQLLLVRELKIWVEFASIQSHQKKMHRPKVTSIIFQKLNNTLIMIRTFN